MVPVLVIIKSVGGNKPHDFPAQAIVLGATAVAQVYKIEVVPFAAFEAGSAFEGEFCVGFLVFYVGSWKHPPSVIFGISHTGIGFDNHFVVGGNAAGVAGCSKYGSDD